MVLEQSTLPQEAAPGTGVGEGVGLRAFDVERADHFVVQLEWNRERAFGAFRSGQV